MTLLILAAVLPGFVHCRRQRGQALLVFLPLFGSELELNLSVGIEEPPEQQWEYLIQSVPDLQFTDMMTLYGLDGWELVFARRAIIESVAQPNA